MHAERGQVQLTYEYVDEGVTPLGVVTLRRYVTQDDQTGYEISLDGNFLMATHGHHSETVMAELAYRAFDGRDGGLRVCVGGLGAGYTLRAALDLAEVTEVTVVEIAPQVIDWNRRYFAATNGDVLADERVRVVIGDVGAHLADQSGRYDLILLDADNGPGWLAAQGNEALYTVAGLDAARRALVPRGALAVWSPSPNEVFFKRFRAVFPDGSEVKTDEVGRNAGEPADVVYVGVRR